MKDCLEYLLDARAILQQAQMTLELSTMNMPRCSQLYLSDIKSNIGMQSYNLTYLIEAMKKDKESDNAEM